MPRLFVAIDFPEAVNQQLIGLCKDISKAKWIKPGQIHLTLRFIGEVTDEQAELLKLALREVRAKAFDLQLKGTGTFPQEADRRPRVLWANVEAGPELRELAGKVDEAARAAGQVLKNEDFIAHVTLARFRYPPGPELRRWQKRYADFESQVIRVSHFHLNESRLNPDGAIHTIIESFRLS
ncbi:MAG: RNA 2',3'-cyclic phosphodiesterase [Planctomycetes bacterium]|nr:RNA 2',3'-cyclic phosphodiesterase [Planctomycetota bacterium]